MKPVRTPRLTVDKSNMSLEINKVHVYIQATRDLEHPAWLPRPAATKPLDLLVTAVKHTECKAACSHGIALKSKLSKMAACAVVVRPKEAQSGYALDNPQDDQTLWFEWDGKLHGLE